MDFQPLIDWGYSFYLQNSTFCHVFAAALLFFILWKPAKILKGIFLLLIMVIILYICYQLIGSMNAGMDIKENAVNRTERAIEK